MDGYWLVCSSLLLLPEATTHEMSGQLVCVCLRRWGKRWSMCGEIYRWEGGRVREGQMIGKSCFMCTEADLLTQLHKTAQIKASKGLLTRGNEHTHTHLSSLSREFPHHSLSLSPFPSPTAPPPVESCSMDTLRNSIKILQDLNVLVAVGSSGTLKVGNTSRLVDIIKTLTRLRS